uniref:NB-ARC domain containing protein n=1 Tax=Solanum tuberosum TaxID=4113 RepID=M1D9B7_SOLTU
MFAREAMPSLASAIGTSLQVDKATTDKSRPSVARVKVEIEQTGKLKQCCHDEHTNQQALVTHENEFTVTEKIDGKEINPNTPTMFILDQKVATNNLNESKEKRRGGGESASRWADLVEEENHTPSPSRSKLSPQTLEFVPTSKANSSMAVIGTSSNLSATKVNMDDRDFLYDLDNDMSDGDDEDEMLDICFDKVAKEGDLSPRQQIKKWKHQMQKEDT